ncbi:MAG: type IV toxin-antitoxin system AbiEi family antitoxin domain-containing protein [Clostridiales Family XIII bacterium]|jgi:CRP-like cAMP-binding protein|nr:type IV toxin-antitoxin system AbiEi family antitoxin domain-containing protein [Clostridiales Family XIII bacterium]
MGLQDKLGRVFGIAASQWGLITSAQAVREGLSRNALSSLTRNGVLERVRMGVYRVSAAPRDAFTEAKAAWLSLAPETDARERIAHPGADYVLSRDVAALLHGIAGVHARPNRGYVFSCAGLRKVNARDIFFIDRALNERDIVIAEGMPVTSRDRTIADLRTSDDRAATRPRRRVRPAATQNPGKRKPRERVATDRHGAHITDHEGKEAIRALLTEMRCFEGLRRTEIDALCGAIRPRAEYFKSGDIIMRMGEVLNDLLLLESGTVFSRMDYAAGGREDISSLYAPPAFVEPEIALSSKRTLRTSLAGGRDGRLYRIALSDLDSLPTDTRLILHRNLTSFVCDSAIRYANRTDILSRHNTDERIIGYFNLQRERQRTHAIRIDMNQAQLARYLSVTRASLTDTLNRMRRRGEIDYVCTRTDMRITLERDPHVRP